MSLDVRWEGVKEWKMAEDKWSIDTVIAINDEIKDRAYKIERDAKLAVPVDTGELRKSIETDFKSSLNNPSAEIGTNVEYSDSVEFGTSKQRAQPYLIPSFEKNIKDLQKNITKILRG